MGKGKRGEGGLTTGRDFRYYQTYVAITWGGGGGVNRGGYKGGFPVLFFPPPKKN